MEQIKKRQTFLQIQDRSGTKSKNKVCKESNNHVERVEIHYD